MRRTLLRAALVGVGAPLTLLLGSTAYALDIGSSTGPLTTVDISTDLNCAVNHTGDTYGEFFGDTACGTLLATGGTLFGPASIPAGGSAWPRTTWTAVSQTARTGSGTSSDPYQVVTTVDAGSTGLRLVETDSYVAGEETYRTDVVVSNSTTASQSAVLYRAGDCYLQNSDFGYGQTYGTSGAIACLTADPTNSAIKGTRIEQWYPLTPGSHYYEDGYDAVWAWIGTQQPFNDTCAQCDNYIDNGAGLSWSISVPAGGSVTESHLTSFSPTGVVPLSTAKTADAATASAGGSDGYTITVSNAGSADVPLTSVTDTLPTGFAYTAGSSSGATTSDPAVSGSTLTWSLSGVSVPHGGSVSLHFGVGVGCTAGTFYNDAGGTATGAPVVAVTHTAPVTVSGSCTGTPPPPPDTTTLGAAAATTQYSDPLVMSATLTDTTTGSPLTGAPVSFSFQGTSYPATTGTGGVATATVPQVLTAPGSGSYGVSYAGDATHAPSTGTGTVTVTREDCLLSYTGDLSVAAGSPVNLSASLTEPDTTLGDRSGKTVDFLLSGSGGAPAGDPTAVTSSAGAASTTFTLPADVYSVQVRFPGDTYYTACSSSGNDLVTVGGADALVTGGGFITNGGRTSFGFNAQSTSGVLSGQLQVRAPGRHRFHGDSVTSLSSSGSTATWSGSGSWDGVSGATFTVSVADNRNGGSRRGTTADTFSVEVRSSTGAVLFSASGSLVGGNITVHTT